MERKDSTIKNDWDEKPSMVINELSQAKGLVEQLQVHVMDSPSSTPSSKELMTKIVSSYRSSLSMLNGVKLEGAEDTDHLPLPNGIIKLEGGGEGETSLSKLKGKKGIKSESDETSLSTSTRIKLEGDDPLKMTANIPTESPRSSTEGLGNHDDPDLVKKQSKIRKCQLRWKEQARVCERSGLQGPLDDGYNWRKYGQKDIFGAAYPRAYFRCTHRIAQACLANKQVQRSDADPSIFDVTYQGVHTCDQASTHSLPAEAGNSQNKQDRQKLKTPQETLLNFKTGCHVKVEDFGSLIDPKSTSFSSLPSSSSSSRPSRNVSKKEKNTATSSSSKPLNRSISIDSVFHPSLTSPATSNSNFFPPYGANNLGGGQNLQSDHNNEFASATRTWGITSSSEDFSLDFLVDFDSNTPFNH